MSIRELLFGKMNVESLFSLPQKPDIYYLISGRRFTMDHLQYGYVKDIIEGEGYDLFYVPDVMQGLDSDVLKYNFPGVKINLSQEDFSLSVARQLSIDLDENSACLVWFNEDTSAFEHSEPQGNYETFHSQVYEMFNSVLDVMEPDIRFRAGSADLFEECCDCSLKMPMEEIAPCTKPREAAKKKKPFLRNIFKNEEVMYDLCDDIDDLETQQKVNASPELDILAQEAREAIERLLLSGFSADVIKSWLEPQVKLSRVRVTKRYKIIMVDYDIEVKMGPLPKTVFLFFLKHPEGLRFVDLPDYRKEIFDIYSRLAVSDNLEKIERSVSLLTDPFDNSINEKCTMIKYAFQKVVTDDVASHYYVSGKQGHKMNIPLDRSLVEWE